MNLFQFLTRLLTSNNLEFFITYLVGRNGAMWKTCFSTAQNARIENELKHKNEGRKDFLLTVSISSMKDYTCITGWAHKRQKFTLISIKIMRILKFLLTRNRVFKHKEVVSKLHVCSNGLWKIWATYIFHLSTRILNSTH